jgi:hypothetical protein
MFGSRFELNIFIGVRSVPLGCATGLGRHPNQKKPGWEEFQRMLPNSLIRQVCDSVVT